MFGIQLAADLIPDLILRPIVFLRGPLLDVRTPTSSPLISPGSASTVMVSGHHSLSTGPTQVVDTELSLMGGSIPSPTGSTEPAFRGEPEPEPDDTK